MADLRRVPLAEHLVDELGRLADAPVNGGGFYRAAAAAALVRGGVCPSVDVDAASSRERVAVAGFRTLADIGVRVQLAAWWEWAVELDEIAVDLGGDGGDSAPARWLR